MNNKINFQTLVLTVWTIVFILHLADMIPKGNAVSISEVAITGLLLVIVIIKFREWLMMILQGAGDE